MRSIVRVAVFMCLANICMAQQFFRMKADYSIKQKKANGESALIIGKVYYDRTAQKIIYFNTFPKKETDVLADTILYAFVDNKLVSKNNTYFTYRYSVFHLALIGKLNTFGLEGSVYKLLQTEKEKDLVITTWQADGKAKEKLGKIILSTKNKKLYGVVVFDNKNKIIMKQFFKNFVNVNGMDFPTEITQISYDPNGKESYGVTTYKNIVVDDIKEDNIYNYSLPK
jgi:hypothetical protein